MQRTQKSIKNIFVALVLFAINLVLQFVSRKVFIEKLGADVLGLNATVISILQFLNISELGISSAIACTLYKPLYDRDHKSISEVVSIHGWLYRRIGTLITLLSVGVLLFIPMIFAKSSLPLWYAYASFVVLLLGNLPGYFLNYDQVLFSADQRDYKIQYAYKLPMAAKVLFQIICISCFANGYVWWLVCELVFAVLAAILLKVSVRKSYPYLEIEFEQARENTVKYPGIISKVKQLFVHKVSSFALSQLSPLIIYALATLSLVTVYGNYFLIISGVMSLLNAMFNSMNGGVGNLVAEGDRKHTLDVFGELFTSRFLMVSVCSVIIYYMADPFVSMWVGDEFIIDKHSLLFMVLIFYINTMRSVVDSFINAYGLFADIWAPMTETALNLGLSVILGRIFGLPGILMGVLISLIAIIFFWKPYYVFKKGLEAPIRIYVLKYLKHIIAFVVAFAAFRYVYTLLPLPSPTTILTFVEHVAVVAVLMGMPLAIILWIADKGMRAFTNRIYHLIKR